MTAKSTFEVRVQRLNETPGSMRVDDASSAATYWREKITAMPWYDPEREMCVAVMLNTRLSPVGHTLVGIGTLNECTVHPRDVFRAAVAMAAYAVLVIHNHPSGVMPNAVLCRTEVAIPLANRSPMRRKKGEAGEL